MLILKVEPKGDDEKVERARWLEHAWTKRTGAAALECWRHASEELFSACRRSPDADVRGAYARLMALAEVGKVFNGTD